MSPSWFIAFPVTCPPLLDACLAHAPAGLKAFAPSDRHLTVAFLGACGEAAALRAWSDAQPNASQGGVVTLGGVTALGDPRAPSALSATVRRGNDALTAYTRAHRRTWLLLANAPKARHPPLPHVTLARLSRRTPARQRQRAIAWAETLPVVDLPATLGPLALFTWSEDRRERLFQRVAVASP